MDWSLGPFGKPRFSCLHSVGRPLIRKPAQALVGLRRLQDAEGLAAADKLALERLPESVRHQTGETAKLVAALQALDVQQRGLALDTLYELATPAAIAAVRAVLRETAIDRPQQWRYVKSIVKRACGKCFRKALTAGVVRTTSPIRSVRTMRIFLKRVIKYLIKKPLCHHVTRSQQKFVTL